MIRSILSVIAILAFATGASAQVQTSLDFAALQGECQKSYNVGLCEASVDYLRLSHEAYVKHMGLRQTGKALEHLQQFNNAMSIISQDFPAVWATRKFVNQRSA